MANLKAAYRRLCGVEAMLRRQDGPYSLAVAEEVEQKILRFVAEYQAMPEEERARWDALDEDGEADGEDDPRMLRLEAAIEAVSAKSRGNCCERVRHEGG